MYICPTGGVLVVMVACEISPRIFSQSNGSLSLMPLLAIAFSKMEIKSCERNERLVIHGLHWGL